MDVRIRGKVKKVSDKLAAALVKMGRAEYVTAHIAAPSVADNGSPATKKRGRTRKYQRRDLTAED